MRRREFITLLGGAASAMACPLVAGAQQGERLRCIGVLMNLAEGDPEALFRVAAFAQGLGELGWTIGRNVRIELRWSAGDNERFRKNAAELVALAPDIILASGFPSMVALQPVTRSVPVVFVLVTDPVGAGFVESLARPGGNVTGFALFEFGMSGKWLELLKQIAPDVTRVGVLRDTTIASGTAMFAAVQAVAPSLGVDVSPIGVRDAPEIERSITAFARSGHGGLIMTPSALAAVHRNLIMALAARHKLPAVYFQRLFVSAGGLASYGPDFIDQHRRAAGYVDRILKGEKPGDLPVQSPTKYETVINLKTARTLGISVPKTLLALADEVIE